MKMKSDDDRDNDRDKDSLEAQPPSRVDSSTDWVPDHDLLRFRLRLDSADAI